MINTTLLMVAGCLLVAYLLYKEWMRPRRAHLLVRLLVSLLAITALVCLAYPRAEKTISTKQLILLTDGFVKDSVKKFLRTHKDAAVVASVGIKETIIDGSLLLPVTNWQSFAVSYPGTVIHVFGNGLDKAELQLLKPSPIIFHPAPARPAVSQVNWKRNLSAGEPLVVQGHYINSSTGKIKLALDAFGSIKDELVIDAGQEKDFSLQVIPLHAGRATYSLLAIAGTDTLQREPVPVFVDRSPMLKMLIIAAAPDFENTYLKNYLSQQGYTIVASTVISTNIANRQFLNTGAQKNQLLSPSYITGFDVLLADAETLQKMDKPARTAIASAVQSMGIGLVVKMDKAKSSNDFYAKFFPVKKLPQKKPAVQLHESTVDSNRYNLNIADPEYIAYVDGVQPLLLDAQSNAFASAIQYGNGKIVATTLSNTYSMALAGGIGAYRRLWSFLLNKASRKRHAANSWLINPAMPYVNQPVYLQTVSNAAVLQKASVGAAYIDLKADPGLSFRYNGVYWPVIAGWQPNPLPGDTDQLWYAYNTNDWLSIVAYARRQQTREYEKQDIVKQEQQSNAGNGAVFPLPLLLFLLFLGCCIFLWVEQKTG